MKITYVDDVNFLAEGENFKEVYERLHDMMTQDGGGQAWSREHNLRFEMSKLTLVGFSRRHVPDPAWPGRMMLEACPAFTTCGTTIEAVPSHKFLGVIFDQELWWSKQAERVTAKAMKWSLCTRQLVRPATGVSPRQMRQLYQVVVVPSYTYAADVWFNPVI